MAVESFNFVRYLFLGLFLAVFFGIIIFCIISNKRVDRNSQINRNKSNSRLYEKILVLILLCSLPGCIISALVFQNVTAALIFAGLFASVIIFFTLFSGVGKVSIVVYIHGSRFTAHYTIEDFERKLKEGSIDLNNVKVKYPRGYTPPKQFFGYENDQYDPFSKFD